MGTEIKTLNTQALQERALALWVVDETCALQLGRALVAVRDAMFAEGHGNFTAWYRTAKLSENRVQYCLRLAEGKVDKAKARKKIPERPSLRFEKAAADSIRTSLQHLTSGKDRKLNLSKDIVERILHGAVSGLYLELAELGVVVNPTEPPAHVEESWRMVESALRKFVEAAYQPPLAANLSQ